MIDPSHYFQSRAVRDLTWIISSRCLMRADSLFLDDKWCDKCYEKHLDWLTELDANPQEIEQYIEERPTNRLGLYAEHLVRFWLSNSPHFELLASNLQVKNAHHTFGEFDFIVKDQDSKEVFHWEIAVKYYLGASSSEEWDQWIGPGGKDHLSMKMNKIIERQAVLSHLPEGKQRLVEIGIDQVEPRVLLKGYFFLPFGVANFSSPQLCNRKHLGGWWLHKGELGRLAPLRQEWKVIPKKEWLSEQVLNPDDAPLSFERISREIDRLYEMGHSSVLLASFAPTNEGWHEKGRGFIVRDGWPTNSSSPST